MCGCWCAFEKSARELRVPGLMFFYCEYRIFLVESGQLEGGSFASRIVFLFVQRWTFDVECSMFVSFPRRQAGGTPPPVARRR